MMLILAINELKQKSNQKLLRVSAKDSLNKLKLSNYVKYVLFKIFVCWPIGS